jgi:hypothetical protein
MNKVEEKFKLKMKRASAYAALQNPNYEDYSLLDKDADDWLTRLNVPAKYERQDIKTRKYEKPEGVYINNGRKL